ncbi:hypothetical protein ACQKWADRAFT_291666 [Trichoderma austrokoningii]
MSDTSSSAELLYFSPWKTNTSVPATPGISQGTQAGTANASPSQGYTTARQYHYPFPKSANHYKPGPWFQIVPGQELLRKEQQKEKEAHLQAILRERASLQATRSVKGGEGGPRTTFQDCFDHLNSSNWRSEWASELMLQKFEKMMLEHKMEEKKERKREKKRQKRKEKREKKQQEEQKQEEKQKQEEEQKQEEKQKQITSSSSSG